MYKILSNDLYFLIASVGESNGTPLQYFCLKNSMDRGAWQAAVHGVTKSRTRLSDFAFTFHFHALEKEMATHSNVLAWRIPETAEPGRLLSMGSHRSDLNEATQQQQQQQFLQCLFNITIYVTLLFLKISTVFKLLIKNVYRLTSLH